MMEAINALVNFVGVFLGAFLAYCFTLRLENRKKKEKLKIVIPLIAQDLKYNFLDIETTETFSNNYNRIKKKYDESEVAEDKDRYQSQMAKLRDRIQLRLQFKKDLFLTLLHDILLLETDIAMKVINCYKLSERIKHNLLKYFLEENLDAGLQETKSRIEALKAVNEEIETIFENWQA